MGISAVLLSGSSPSYGSGIYSADEVTGGILRYNAPFTIHYTPDPVQINIPQSSRGFVLLFHKDLFNPPEVIDMVRKKNTWETTFTLSDTSIKMVMLAFQALDSLGLRSTASIADNRGQYWDLLVYNPAGQPVRGACEARAASFTGMGGKRKEDLDKALDEILKELKLYPENLTARSLYYSIQLRINSSDAYTRSTIRKDVEKILARDPENEKLLRFALQSYRMIGASDEAEEIEKTLIEKDPGGEQAAMSALNEIMQETDEELRNTELEDFLLEYPESRLTELALSTLATSAIEQGDSTAMINIGDRILKKGYTPASASALAGLAGVLTENRYKTNRAVAYADRALRIILETGYSMKPPEASKEDWEQQVRLTEARYRDILGWAIVQAGRLGEGIPLLRQATQGTRQPSVFLHMGLALEQADSLEQALPWYARAGSFEGEIGDAARQYLQSLWERLSKNPAEIDGYLENEARVVHEDYRRRVLERRNVRKAPDFELEDISGGWIRLSDQEDNVVILCFWATWSESSRRLMADLEELAGKYGRRVLFMTIALDLKQRTVDIYAEKNDIGLPVAMNADTDKDYQLQGVPTLYVIDKKGKVVFEHRGYSPDIKEILKIEFEDLLK